MSAREFHDKYGSYPSHDSMDTWVKITSGLTTLFCWFILAIMCAIAGIVVLALVSAPFVDGNSGDVPLKCTEYWLSTHNGVCP